MSLTRDEIETVAKAAGIAAARETMGLIGIDVSRPFDMQADFAHLRRWRNLVERSTAWAVITFIGVVVTGFTVYIGFRPTPPVH